MTPAQKRERNRDRLVVAAMLWPSFSQNNQGTEEGTREAAKRCVLYADILMDELAKRPVRKRAKR